jgi:hypothetical protein
MALFVLSRQTSWMTFLKNTEDSNSAKRNHFEYFRIWRFVRLIF